MSDNESGDLPEEIVHAWREAEWLWQGKVAWDRGPAVTAQGCHVLFGCAG